MREFRTIWMVASVIAAAIVAAFAAVMFRMASQGPPPTHQKTNASKEKAPAPPKTSARISAPTTLNYYRVKVALNGTLQAGKHTFHLYAADVPGREETCTYRNGQRWACGLRAYVALLNLIGSEPIECHPKDTLKPDTVICHHGNVDLSEWMLEHGWARLAPDATEKPYVEAAEAAKAAQVGLWTPAPEPLQGAAAQ